jgi:AcrR family transcriptional regulator
MGRPKGYDRDTVLIAARDLFWERGFEATSISQLERRTGLNRSSLYQDFGTKHDLFEAALECYADQVVASLLADLRQPTMSLDTVATFFTLLGRLFRTNAALGTRGCLLVNATAELAARDDRIQPAVARYRDFLRTTFAAALTRAAERGEIETETVQNRAHLLAATLMGIWLTVRIDPRDASRLCDRIAAEVAGWRTPE